MEKVRQDLWAKIHENKILDVFLLYFDTPLIGFLPLWLALFLSTIHPYNLLMTHLDIQYCWERVLELENSSYFNYDPY